MLYCLNQTIVGRNVSNMLIREVGDVMGIVVMAVYWVQLTTFEGGIMLLLFPLAHLLCAVRSLVLFVWHYTEQHLPKQGEIPSKVQFYAAELLRQSAK